MVPSVIATMGGAGGASFGTGSSFANMFDASGHYSARNEILM